MKILVKVKTNTRAEIVDEISPGNYVVAVKERAREGRANKAIIRLLAEYFRVSKAAIAIISGEKRRQKIIEIISARNNILKDGSYPPQPKK